MKRIPKPAKLKVLEGNPGKRRIPRPPITSSGADLAPPSHLSESASEEWRRVVDLLDAEQLWTDVDRTALEVYVEAVATFREAVKYVRSEGVMVSGQKAGTVVKNPAIQVARDSASVIRSLGSEFGMTPYTRMQLGLPVQKVEDLDAGFEEWAAQQRRGSEAAAEGEP